MKAGNGHRWLVAVFAFSAIVVVLAVAHRWPVSFDDVNRTLQTSAAVEANLDAGAIGYGTPAGQPAMAAATIAVPP
jgi:hypothetical protein